MIRSDLASQLIVLQQGDVDLDQFELWLVGQLQRFAEASTEDAELATYLDRLDALLIQYGESVISWGEWNNAIEDILRNLNTLEVELPISPWSSIILGTDTQDVGFEFTDSRAVEDLRLPAVLVQ